MSQPLPVPPPEEAPSRLPHAIRTSLCAKIERLLTLPLIAEVRVPDWDADDDVVELPGPLLALQRAALLAAPVRARSTRRAAWSETADGTCRVQIVIDYDDRWRDRAKEVLETVKGTVEEHVVFLTPEHRRLLEHAPREFMALNPRPPSAELLEYRVVEHGSEERVVELVLERGPIGRESITHVAVVPNLIPLERQLAGLDAVERADDHGPLAALRVLLGLADASCLPTHARDFPHAEPARGLDEFQAACVEAALATPHFAVIQGPPGSGKTTVITEVLRREVERGARVLVVSPTHVAVDNVVEKLITTRAADGSDPLAPATLPVRYASKKTRVHDTALPYWVGPRRQHRAGAIAARLGRRLAASSSFAEAVMARVDPEIASIAELSMAVGQVTPVLCGTPIGLLSLEAVRDAPAGSFDLLVVDEVSKMTLPEFLAIAPKARRWLLVGDPQQLPPYNAREENGTSLDDLFHPTLELACSVAALMEFLKPEQRRGARLVVVARDPEHAAKVIEAQLRGVQLEQVPPVVVLGAGGEAQAIVVCRPSEVDTALAQSAPTRDRDRTHRPEHRGTVEILVERGIELRRPSIASGARLVEAHRRVQATLFEKVFGVYHAQPWARRARQRLPLVGLRNGIEKILPSRSALAALDPRVPVLACGPLRQLRIDLIAERFAANAVSVYDWLSGIPVDDFDVSPLCEVARVSAPLHPLRTALQPYVGTLRKQYRMHDTLAQVPRELFYFGDALLQGRPDRAGGCRVSFVQVPGAASESNAAEVTKVCELLDALGQGAADADTRPSVMVITAYRAQESLLRRAIGDAQAAGGPIVSVDVEVCTFDRCQGREADYVVVSLVRSRATPFLDAPKRWNVALTRAREGLSLVGDIDAYLAEAHTARHRASQSLDDDRPKMSLLARVLYAYDTLITNTGRSPTRRTR